MIEFMYLVFALLILLGVAAVIVYRAEQRVKRFAGTIFLGFFMAVGLNSFGGNQALGEEKAAQKAEGANTQSGAQLYSNLCESCHPKGGNTVNPKVPLKGSQLLGDFDTFLQFIRGKKSVPGTAREMPSFSTDEISDQQARDIYQYIGKDIDKP